MRKPLRRNTRKPAPQPQDKMVTILQDISVTLEVIQKLLEEEQEKDEPEPEPKQQPQPQANPQATGSV